MPGSGPIPKIATKIAANNKSGIVRIKFNINRVGPYKKVEGNTLLADSKASGIARIDPKVVPIIAIRMVSKIAFVIAPK